MLSALLRLWPVGVLLGADAGCRGGVQVEIPDPGPGTAWVGSLPACGARAMCSSTAVVLGLAAAGGSGVARAAEPDDGGADATVLSAGRVADAGESGVESRRVADEAALTAPASATAGMDTA